MTSPPHQITFAPTENVTAASDFPRTHAHIRTPANLEGREDITMPPKKPLETGDGIAPAKRRKRSLPGVSREDSDDELGSEDLPWEWIYSGDKEPRGGAGAGDSANGADQGDRKRRKLSSAPKIVGARMGDFECRVGDTVLLKADGSGEAWVALILRFVDQGDEEDKAAEFMWFSTEREIRNRDRKRSDFYWVSPRSSMPFKLSIYAK
jgi:hypothetical protein